MLTTQQCSKGGLYIVQKCMFCQLSIPIFSDFSYIYGIQNDNSIYLVGKMMKRIILVVFLLFGFQFAMADIASDIADGLSAEQAAQNAQAAGLTAEEIAAQLVAAGITNTGTIVSALTAAGFTGTDLASVAAAAVSIASASSGSPGYSGSTGSGGGGGGGGAAVSN